MIWSADPQDSSDPTILVDQIDDDGPTGAAVAAAGAILSVVQRRASQEAECSLE